MVSYFTFLLNIIDTKISQYSKTEMWKGYTIPLMVALNQHVNGVTYEHIVMEVLVIGYMSNPHTC